MAYFVKEIFYSLQGEGVHVGRPAVFIRFSGCNLWSGKESERESAICRLCDTDFVGTDGGGGGRYEDAFDLASAAAGFFPEKETGGSRPFVVLTGGEPALQVDNALIEELQRRRIEIAIETNGTFPIPERINWVTVSPKAGTSLVLSAGDELKLLYPQAGIEPFSLETLDFRNFVLQPVYGPAVHENVRLAIAYCLEHPRWRLGLQLHRILGIK